VINWTRARGATAAEALLRGKLFQHVTRMIKDCLAFLLLINGGLFFTEKKCLFLFFTFFFLGKQPTILPRAK